MRVDEENRVLATLSIPDSSHYVDIELQGEIVIDLNQVPGS